MRVSCFAAVMAFAGTVVCAEPAAVHLVIENTDGTHTAGRELPLSDAQNSMARHVWAWTTEVPPRRFEPHADIAAELRKTKAHSLQVAIRGWSSPEELAALRVIAAPREMWLSVPEPLLPTFVPSREGRVTIPCGDPVRVRVVGPKASTIWQDVPSRAHAIDLSLRKPSADAVLRFRASDGGFAGRVFALALWRARGESIQLPQAQFASDGSGVMRIPSLPVSEVITLFVTSDRAAPQTISGTAAELSRTIRLPAPARISGRFLDDDRTPVAGVRVEAEAWVSSEAPVPSRSAATSDANGSWVIGGLPAGQAIVRTNAAGRVTFRKHVALEEGADLDLGAIPLPPSTDVFLDVMTADGEPVAGVRVTTDSGFRGTTDKKGRVTLQGLFAVEPNSVTLMASGYAKQTIELVPPLAEKERVVLERAFSVRGNVLDDAGGSVPDATAVLVAGPLQRRVNAAADGSLSFDFEPGKEFDLTIESPSFASVTRHEPAGRAGEIRDLGTIRLSAGRSVRGRIVDSADSPVEGARVWTIRTTAAGAVLAWAGGRIIQAMSDSDGNFELRGLEPGSVLLRVDAPEFARAYRHVLTDAEPVDLGTIELAAGTTVTIRARHDDARTARLDLRGEWFDADMLSAPVVEGEARLRHVPAGTFKVTVVNARAVVCERTVDVKENSDTTVECPPPMIVRGRVLLSGSPAYAGSLTWNRPSNADALINNRVSALGALQQDVYGLGSGTVVVPVRADGTFETDELRAGEWQVSWRSPEGGGTPDRTFIVPDRPDANLVVEFRGGVVRGRVVDVNDQPIARARVREIEGPSFAMSASDGTFTLTAVAPGTHRLQATLGPRASRVVDVLVTPDGPSPDVQLEIDDVERDVITIRVLGAVGNPLPNAFVFAERKILTTDGSGIARASYPEGRPKRVIVFANNEWAIADAAGEHEIVVRFATTGAMKIRSRTASGEAQVISMRGGDLSWMLERVGQFLSLGPDTPLVIRGLPPGRYEVRVGAAAAAVSVTTGSTATVDLP